MVFLNDLTMAQLVTRLLAMLALSLISGLSVALMLGDRGPKSVGRLSLSPAAQPAWSGLVMGVLFGPATSP